MIRICNRMGPRAIKESLIARGRTAITCLSHKEQSYRLRGNRCHARFFSFWEARSMPQQMTINLADQSIQWTPYSQKYSKHRGFIRLKINSISLRYIYLNKIQLNQSQNLVEDPLVTSLALAETWLWRMASSDVESDITMADMIDLNGNPAWLCVHWEQWLEHLSCSGSCICSIADDVGHNTLLVFITGEVVIQSLLGAVASGVFLSRISECRSSLVS